MKNLSLQQPSESIGEEQDSDELDLGDDDIDLQLNQVEEKQQQPQKQDKSMSQTEETLKSDSKDTGKMETPNNPNDISLDCHDKKAHCGNHYKTE